jgi:2',3'-cyclic-nucleotide 2'-phosphodiesterase (5'-nucleotidase family)
MGEKNEKNTYYCCNLCSIYSRTISTGEVSIANVDKTKELRKAKYMDIVTKRLNQFEKYGKIPSNIYSIPDRYKAKKDEVKVNVLATADVHNCMWNWNWNLQKINNKDMVIPNLAGGGLEKVATYVNEQRKRDKQLILVDGGDQDLNINEKSMNMMNIMNILKYDAMVPGNHEFMNTKPQLDLRQDVFHYELSSPLDDPSGSY